MLTDVQNRYEAERRVESISATCYDVMAATNIIALVDCLRLLGRERGMLNALSEPRSGRLCGVLTAGEQDRLFQWCEAVEMYTAVRLARAIESGVLK